MPHGFGYIELSKETKFVPSQRFAGIQVIDSKGAVIGNVKDVSVDFKNKGLAFRVTTKARTEMDVPWDDVLSVEHEDPLIDPIEGFELAVKVLRNVLVEKPPSRLWYE
jgi:sporulation protein YlmC with PRC-barrel domain